MEIKIKLKDKPIYIGPSEIGFSHDVYYKKFTNDKDKGKIEVCDYVAFGVTLKRAIHIVTYLGLKKKDEIVSFQEYVERYEKAIDLITKQTI